MKESEKFNMSGNVSGLWMLGLLFVGLKLTGHIDWSWWWVTLPYWGSLPIVIVLYLIWSLFKMWREWLRFKP